MFAGVGYTSDKQNVVDAELRPAAANNPSKTVTIYSSNPVKSCNPAKSHPAEQVIDPTLG